MTRTLLLTLWLTLLATPCVALNATVCFTPGPTSCVSRIAQELSQARSTVQVQAYSFTSKEIAQALSQAHQRGVQVEVLVDKSQRSEKHSVAQSLAEEGIPVRVDASHAIAHNKVIVIDGRTVITGSYNFTKSAEERNAENVVFLYSEELAKLYEGNISEHKTHSAPW